MLECCVIKDLSYLNNIVNTGIISSNLLLVFVFTCMPMKVGGIDSCQLASHWESRICYDFRTRSRANGSVIYHVPYSLCITDPVMEENQKIVFVNEIFETRTFLVHVFRTNVYYTYIPSIHWVLLCLSLNLHKSQEMLSLYDVSYNLFNTFV